MKCRKNLICEEKNSRKILDIRKDMNNAHVEI